MANNGVNTEYTSRGEPVIYQSASTFDGWDWYQVFREPDDVLCIMYGKNDNCPELPAWFEIA